MKILLLLSLIIIVGCTAPLSTATVTQDTVIPKLIPSATQVSINSPTSTSTTTAAPTSITTEPNLPSETPTAEAIVTLLPTQVDKGPSDGPIYADHDIVDQFDQIPDTAIEAAANLRLLFRHASVGENIKFGLSCIWGNFPDRRPSACGDFFEHKYDPSKWVFEARGNPGWVRKIDDFIQQTNQRSDDFDVVGFAIDYVDGLDTERSPISSIENFNERYIKRLEALEAAHPDKIFIWWTMSLARIGQKNTQDFNSMVRSYAISNHKILFDIADIESHDPKGNPSLNEDGYEVIYDGYTDEKVSGHLNKLGQERVARAFWWLMARISGWDGVK